MYRLYNGGSPGVAHPQYVGAILSIMGLGIMVTSPPAAPPPANGSGTRVSPELGACLASRRPFVLSCTPPEATVHYPLPPPAFHDSNQCEIRPPATSPRCPDPFPSHTPRRWKAPHRRGTGTTACGSPSSWSSPSMAPRPGPRPVWGIRGREAAASAFPKARVLEFEYDVVTHQFLCHMRIHIAKFFIPMSVICLFLP